MAGVAMKQSLYITVTDQFCGAGGSSIGGTATGAEEFLPVPGFKNIFEVSDQGRVYRVVSTYGRPTRKLRKPERIKGGYLRVSLQHRKKRVRILIHRLVAMVFLGDCPDGFEVNHKDGDKENNAVSNLEYVTPKENVRHSLAKLGVQRASGEHHAMRKLSWQQVREVRTKWLNDRVTKKQLAAEYGVSESAIGRVINRRNWKME